MSQTKLIINNNGYKTECILERYNKDAITFGRDPKCDIVINNYKVSAYHGYIYRYNGKWYIKDQNSLNGILINGVKVTEIDLRNGARIILDRQVLSDSVIIEFQEIQGVGYQGNAPQNAAYQRGPQQNAGYQSSPQQGVGYRGNGAQSMSYQQGSAYRNPAPAAAQTPRPQSNQSVKKDDAQNRKGNIGLALGIISLVLVVILMIVVGIFIFGKDDDDKKAESTTEQITTEAASDTSTEATTEATTSSTDEMTGEEIFNLADPSTVEIIATVADNYGSLGTGFYIDTDGTIVTNYHVIDQARSIVVKASDGTEYQVTGVKGYDSDMDIAILSTTAGKTVPLERKTDEVKTGEKVYALGNSQGYQSTFTEGIVSSANREENGHKYIQHSAPITNGNSGGPLLDDQGKVIGINTWVRTDGQNLNFAIPIDEIDRISTTGDLSLEEVYGQEYETSTYSQSYVTPDWESVTMAESGSKIVTMKFPDSTEITDEDGSKTAKYLNNDIGINASAEIELGDYSSFTDDRLEAMDDEIISKMSEQIDSVFDNGFQSSAEGWNINGKYWRVYTFSGTSQSYDTNVYLMISYDDDAVASVYVVSMSTDDAIAETSQQVTDILSSVEFK